MFSRLLIILQKINNHGFQPWLVYSTEFHDFFWERYKIKDKSESPASMVITLGRFGIQDEICSAYYVCTILPISFLIDNPAIRKVHIKMEGKFQYLVTLFFSIEEIVERLESASPLYGMTLYVTIELYI